MIFNPPIDEADKDWDDDDLGNDGKIKNVNLFEIIGVGGDEGDDKCKYWGLSGLNPQSVK